METNAYAQGRWNNAFRSQRHFSTNQCQVRAACFSLCRSRRRTAGEKQPVGVRADESSLPGCSVQNLRRYPGVIQGSCPGRTSREPEWDRRVGACVGKAETAAKAAAGAKHTNAAAITRGECGCLSCRKIERLQAGGDSQESPPLFSFRSQVPGESVGRWSNPFVP